MRQPGTHPPFTSASTLPLRDRDLSRMQRFTEDPEVYGDVTWIGPTLLRAVLASA